MSRPPLAFGDHGLAASADAVLPWAAVVAAQGSLAKGLGKDARLFNRVTQERAPGEPARPTVRVARDTMLFEIDGLEADKARRLLESLQPLLPLPTYVVALDDPGT